MSDRQKRNTQLPSPYDLSGLARASRKAHSVKLVNLGGDPYSLESRKYSVQIAHELVRKKKP